MTSIVASKAFAPRNILVPVDVDPAGDRGLAERLVDDAVAFAKMSGAALTLLYVTSPILSPMAPPTDLVTGAYRAMLDVAVARNSASERALKELEARARAAGVGVRSLVTSRAAPTPQAIVEVCGEEKADIIMLSTHGRRGVRRVLLGSVAERTAHLSRVPVLLLPPEVA
jgi:nucleotide-binding universal stress UspA family protein